MSAEQADAIEIRAVAREAVAQNAARLVDRPRVPAGHAEPDDVGFQRRQTVDHPPGVDRGVQIQRPERDAALKSRVLLGVGTQVSQRERVGAIRQRVGVGRIGRRVILRGPGFVPALGALHFERMAEVGIAPQAGLSHAEAAGIVNEVDIPLGADRFLTHPIPQPIPFPDQAFVRDVAEADRPEVVDELVRGETARIGNPHRSWTD